MSTQSRTAEQTLPSTEVVAAILAKRGIHSALIGAVALAAHFYPRSTEDIDLAVGVHPSDLKQVAQDLRDAGFTVEVSEADPQDPLGGVIRARSTDAERIEIVNFRNPPSGGFPALIDAALRDALPYGDGATLRVVSLPHLILFKLYAGGPKSKTDVLELLSRNPGLDLNELRAECRKFRLDKKLDIWLRDLKSTGDE